MLDRDAITALLEIIGGDRADLVDLITSFAEEAPALLAAMTAAAQGDDGATVRRVAHTLKSNARDLGALAFAADCAALEADLSGPGAVEGLIARVAAITGQWTAVSAALMAEIDGAGETN